MSTQNETLGEDFLTKEWMVEHTPTVDPEEVEQYLREHTIKLYKHHLEVAQKIDDNGMRAAGARVLLKLDKAPDRTAGGIIIADTAMRHEPVNGTIVAIGSVLDPDDVGATAEELGMKIGHRAAIAKYRGVTVDLYLDGASGEVTEVQAVNVSDIYVYWDPRVGIEVEDEGTT